MDQNLSLYIEGERLREYAVSTAGSCVPRGRAAAEPYCACSAHACA